MYEEYMKELENIINKLESGDINFDEASKMFERGADICKLLYKELDAVKGKVTVIREELEGLIEEEINS